MAGSIKSKWQTQQPQEDCWLWARGQTDRGYGLVKIFGKRLQAHRVSYETLVGPILPGMFLDHTCRVRCCINPNHLKMVTPRQNVLENSVGIAAFNAKKTKCSRGHPFLGENLRISKTGRVCRICEKMWCRYYREQKKR